MGSGLKKKKKDLSGRLPSKPNLSNPLHSFGVMMPQMKQKTDSVHLLGLIKSSELTFDPVALLLIFGSDMGVWLTQGPFWQKKKGTYPPTLRFY